ncbi:MAG: hypothetical protein E7355_02245 [Clostridiales bacterium]|nr:hypothetical protein [Clostridiales bacterium]
MAETKEKQQRFRELCGEYLAGLSISSLRSYGRELGISAPTAMRKADLVREIICVLVGEKTPRRTKRGAPIKNKYFQKEIEVKIQEIKNEVFGENVQSERKESVQLHFSLVFENLTSEQKERLNYFLNSL